MSIPGVQKPHCRPCSCQNPSWMGCSCSCCSRPSTVSTLRPSVWTVKSVQDLIGLPSKSTVHAPQWVVSHPMCVPVNRKTSRRKWTKSSRGSTSASRAMPLTVTRIRCVAMPLPSCLCHLPTGALQSTREGSGGQHPHHIALVRTRATQVCFWPGFLSRELRRLRDAVLVQALTLEKCLNRVHLQG